MNESRRVEDEDVAVDRDTGATILVGSLRCRRMYILERCEGGPPAAEAWEMIIAEARKSVTQSRSQTGETQTRGILLKYTPISIPRHTRHYPVVGHPLIH